MITLKYFAEIDPLSENTMYTPSIGGHGNRKYSYLRKADHVRDYQALVKSKFQSFIDVKDLSLPIDVDGIIVLYIFGLPLKGYWTRDVTNMVKAVEDVLLGRKKEESILPYDDSKVVASIPVKEITKDVPYLYCEVHLMQSEDKYDCLKDIVTDLYCRQPWIGV